MPKRTADYHSLLLKDLVDPVEASHYLNAALEDSDEMFLLALRDVAEACQMSKVAAGAAISRESIYRMLSRSGNPTYRSLTGILRALKLEITVKTSLAKGPASEPTSDDSATDIVDTGSDPGPIHTSSINKNVVSITSRQGRWATSIPKPPAIEPSVYAQACAGL